MYISVQYSISFSIYHAMVKTNQLMVRTNQLSYTTRNTQAAYDIDMSGIVGRVAAQGGHMLVWNGEGGQSVAPESGCHGGSP